MVLYPFVNLTMDHFFGGTLFSIPLGIEGSFHGSFSKYNKKYLNVICIDFTKAFDKVHHYD